MHEGVHARLPELEVGCLPLVLSTLLRRALSLDWQFAVLVRLAPNTESWADGPIPFSLGYWGIWTQGPYACTISLYPVSCLPGPQLFLISKERFVCVHADECLPVRMHAWLLWRPEEWVSWSWNYGQVWDVGAGKGPWGLCESSKCFTHLSSPSGFDFLHSSCTVSRPH